MYVRIDAPTERIDALYFGLEPREDQLREGFLPLSCEGGFAAALRSLDTRMQIARLKHTIKTLLVSTVLAWQANYRDRRSLNLSISI